MKELCKIIPCSATSRKPGSSDLKNTIQLRSLNNDPARGSFFSRTNTYFLKVCIQPSQYSCASMTVSTRFESLGSSGYSAPHSRALSYTSSFQKHVAPLKSKEPETCSLCGSVSRENSEYSATVFISFWSSNKSLATSSAIPCVTTRSPGIERSTFLKRSFNEQMAVLSDMIFLSWFQSEHHH